MNDIDKYNLIFHYLHNAPNPAAKPTLGNNVETNKENMTQAKMLEMVRSNVLIVGSIDSQGLFSVSGNPAFHYSAQTARAECSRLASLNPGKAFIFMKLAGAELMPATRISI